MERIVNLKVGSSQQLWKLLGPSLYSKRPMFPVTVRELFQNAADAQAANGVELPVEFEVVGGGPEGLWLICRDHGIGMDEDIIHDRFLALGETGKDIGVGGFGVAKAAILGACSAWEVTTRDNFLSSRMLGMEAIQKVDPMMGTEIRLYFTADEESELRLRWDTLRESLFMLAMNERKSRLTINQKAVELGGVQVSEQTLLKRYEEDGNVISVYQVPEVEVDQSYRVDMAVPSRQWYSYPETIKGYVFYRLNGMVQFWQYVGDAEFNLIVEISTPYRPGEGKYPFSTSREKLTSFAAREDMEALFDRMFQNPLTEKSRMMERTGKKKVAKYYYSGNLRGEFYSRNEAKQAFFDHRLQEAKAELEEVMTALVQKEVVLLLQQQNQPRVAARAVSVNGVEMATLEEVKHVLPRLEQSPTGIKTCLKVEEAHKSKKWLAPKNVKLLRVWADMIDHVMQANPVVSHPFGIGLIFDDDFGAEREESRDGTVYYSVNPTRMKVSQRMETVLKMLMDACHEVAHTVESNHGERFTSVMDKLYVETMDRFGFNKIRDWARALLK